ncbi:hypothetical protein CSUB01_09653 [Colletotrichum sublineola]|uniref:Uncharacterized protein n=1 Tax=Colletotrichum sublineola TaxID=1173701 RepID=A0A066X105_COLSU|nr:hypothetical protein CSUB01_09653 [Colletotrichum sublineola]
MPFTPIPGPSRPYQQSDTFTAGLDDNQQQRQQPTMGHFRQQLADTAATRPNPRGAVPSHQHSHHHPTDHRSTHQQDNYSVTTSTPIPRQPTDLAKLMTDEMKYSGEMYDVLDLKLNVFRDNCSKVGIEAHQWAPAFSLMLRGKAATFYFNRICGSNTRDFPTMLSKLRSHFENVEMTQTYLSEWRKTTFSPHRPRKPWQEQTPSAGSPHRQAGPDLTCLARDLPR